MKKTIIRIVLLVMTCALLIGGCAGGGTDDKTTSPSQDTGTDTASTPTGGAAAPTGSTSPSPDEPPDEPTDEPTDEPPGPTGGVPGNEWIGFITQEYDGDNIIEIPCIENDGEPNQVIDSINRLFNQGSQFSVDEFMNNKLDHEWIEIRTYPFTTDKYLQIVVTSCIYPNYGTDGDIESVNYHRISKKWLTLEDALGIMGLGEDDISFGVGANFDPEAYGGLIADLSIDGFLIHDTPEGERIELLLSLTIDNPEADQWQGFFSYTPDGNDMTNDLIQLNGRCLFDPYSMDQMDPPLAYQQNNPQ